MDQKLIVGKRYKTGFDGAWVNQVLGVYPDGSVKTKLIGVPEGCEYQSGDTIYWAPGAYQAQSPTPLG